LGDTLSFRGIGESTATFDNSGVITTTGLDLVFDDLMLLTNSGTINAGGDLVLSIATFTNSGDVVLGGGSTLDANSMTINNQAGATISGGDLIDLYRTLLNLEDAVQFDTDLKMTESAIASIGGGLLTNVAGIELYSSNSSAYNLINVPLTNEALLLVRDNYNYVNASLVNEPGGTVRLLAGLTGGDARLVLSQGMTNRGTLALRSDHSSYEPYLIVNGGSLINEPGGTIDVTVGSATMTFTTASVDNRGDFNVVKRLYLNQSGAHHSNSGSISHTANNLYVQNFNSFDNSGALTNSYGNFTFDGTGSSTVANSGEIAVLAEVLYVEDLSSFINDGDFIVDGGRSEMRRVDSLLNSGTITLENGSLSLYDVTSFTNTGTLIVGEGGTLWADDDTTFTNAVGGLVMGEGLIDTDLTFVNQGTVAPGASCGILHVTGGYQQTAGGILQIEILGTETAGIDFDLLDVIGNVSLSGIIDLQFGSYLPALGDSWTLITASGSLAIGAGLVVTDDLPAAYEFDWDAPGDGTLQLQTTQVPEPASLMLLALGGLLSLMARVFRTGASGGRKRA